MSGEIRKVTNIEKRILEAQKLGFKKIVIPKGNLKEKNNFEIEIIEAARITDAITSCVYKTEK